MIAFPLVILALTSIIAPLLAGLALYDGLRLVIRRKETHERRKEVDIEKHSTSGGIEAREKEIVARENALNEREKDIVQRESLLREEKERSFQKGTDDAGQSQDSEATPQPVSCPEEEALSEKEKRERMIKQEFDEVIKEVEEDELEEDFEPEALDALKIAAMKVAYRKKFYDVFKDEVIFFPSVTKCVTNMTLIEEAEKHYFDEDDEFPIDYTAALREVCTMKISASDDDIDEEYMEKLAMDVEI